MKLLSWLKKKLHAERLLTEALLEFAEGDAREALGDLLQGLIELAEGTGASIVLYNLRNRLAKLNLIPQPATIPLSAAITIPDTTK